MRYCCVPLCYNKNINGTKFFSFPKRDDQLNRFNIWLARIGRIELFYRSRNEICKSYFVCEDHFSALQRRDYNQFKLVCNAVPDINMPYDFDTVAVVHFPDVPEKLSLLINTGINNDYFNFEHNYTSDAYNVGNELEINTHKTSRNKKSHSYKNYMDQRKLLQLTPFCQYVIQRAYRLQFVSKQSQNRKFWKQKRLILTLIKLLQIIEYSTTPVIQRFIATQLFRQTKTSKCCTKKMELFSCTLLKYSPKFYSCLRRCFGLPSRKSLLAKIQKIPVEISDEVISILSKSSKRMKAKESILMWDFISIKPHLNYNAEKDNIEGLHYISENINSPVEFATYIIVFMLCGVRLKWKQPLCYSLQSNQTTISDIVHKITEVVCGVQKAGFKVVATMCRHNSINTAAIKVLKERSESNNATNYIGPGFFIESAEIIPLYDPCQLFLKFRNYFRKYDIIYQPIEQSISSPNLRATWSDIVNLFNFDSEKQYLYKLTDAHLDPEKIHKKKMILACQVLSRTVAGFIYMEARYGKDKVKNKYTEGTAKFIFCIDSLFDSLNGSIRFPKDNNRLKCAIHRKSRHCLFWDKAQNMLDTIYFIKDTPYGTKKVQVSAQQGWKESLINFRYLCRKLFNSGFSYIYPRNFNLDPMENLFAHARNSRNIKPNATAFNYVYRSLLLTNFKGPHPSWSNREDDKNNLCNFHILSSKQKRQTISEDAHYIFLDVNFSINYNMKLNRNYLIGDCPECRHQLLYGDNQGFNKTRAYSYHSLLKPNTPFTRTYFDLILVCSHYLPLIIDRRESRIREMLKWYCENYVDNNYTCDVHEVYQVFLNIFIKLYILSYVKNVNRSLKFSRNSSILKEKHLIFRKAL